LVGITKDPAHGFVLTLAAGGVLTELMRDSQSLLIPATPEAIEKALSRLKIAKMLLGYRGKPAADLPSVISAISAIQAYVLANGDRVAEVEVNPLLCTPTRAVAVDALIREAP
jgi:acetyl-CoA synthetase